MSSAFRAWTATGAATLASTYLLDTVAAATGALVAASGLLHGIGLGAALGFLGATYVAWGLALRPSLAANWDLLQRTATSTCLPSKLAHDVAARHGASARVRRVATATGYVGAELVKEAPYYLGAAGATLLVDGITSADAVAFLGGANLGAAAYECGLAKGIRTYLRRAPQPPFATFETAWDPARYLADYYRAVETDERHTLAFLVEAARGLPADAKVLVFGAGPTMHHAFPFAAAATIDLCDVLPGNLDEIRRWIRRDAGAHDWGAFARHTLACEGLPADDAGVARREAATRARIGRLFLSDLRSPWPPSGPRFGYDVVVTAYCADSATDDRGVWAHYMRRIASLVRPGGLFVVAALRQCRGYRVGDRRFPSADLDAPDLRAVLAPLASCIRVETRLVPEQARHGYGGILLARCRMAAESISSRPSWREIEIGRAIAR